MSDVIAIGIRHLENQVLQRARLRYLPVKPRRYKGLVVVVGGRRHLSEVKDEVANLTEELVLVDVPVLSVPSWDIGVRVKQRNALELIAALNGRGIQCIANELSVVQLNDWAADLVSSRGEVDNGTLTESIAALHATAVAVFNSRIQGLGRVRVARVVGAIVVHHIAEEFVIRSCKRLL